MVKRGFVVSTGAAAIVIAGLVSCSQDKSGEDYGATSTSEAASSDTSSAPPASRLVIGGLDRNAQGAVACATKSGKVNIAIGNADKGVAAVLSDAEPPVVHSVSLGAVKLDDDGEVTLGFQEGSNYGNAEATRDGNTYKISGIATGVKANQLPPVNIPFEIMVTCP